ncbi:MAG: hypothetical protein LC803_18670 [Acidobacteria bacterium]|nr:hypothetical protein [Acidobacteriota bacterium]
MSYRVKMILPIVVMFLTFGYAALAIVRSDSREIKQPLPSSLDNLAAVKLVEIKDGGGRVILSGNFTVTTKYDGEIEEKSPLAATGVDPDARGVAEIEISNKKNSVTEKELEVEVRQLSAHTSYDLFIDGQQAASFKTNHRGEAELEMTNAPST